jgi:hypothetical protein
MYLCFLDESGSPPKPTAKSPRPYFVLAAVIIHEAQWQGIAEEFKKLKEKPDYKVKGEVKWRFFGKDNNDPHNTVAHLDQTKRDSFRQEMLDILLKRKSVKVVACVANVELAYKQPYVKTDADLYAYTYKPVSERFQYFLQEISSRVGATQLGIVICDHRAKNQDEHIRTIHHKIVDGDGKFTSKYGNYIETIFMTPSHLSVGIQFADVVAGAIGRNFNTGDDKFFNTIMPLFRTSNTGKIEGYGLVKFPSGW